jgi:two-component system NtrC family sensor kinase
MAFLDHLTPKFLGSRPIESSGSEGLNFRKIWRLTTIATLGVALLPLVIMVGVDYHLSRETTLSEILLRTSRLVSNSRRSVSYYLAEHRAAIEYVSHYTSYAQLIAPGHLDKVLQSLQASFGGFVDMGVIDDQGCQCAYSGPYNLVGKNYRDADWFQEVAASRVYISDVFKGLRNIPHMVITVRHDQPDGRFYVLRATLETSRFNDLLAHLEIGGEGDAFLINHEGILQTPSRLYGPVLERIALETPPFAEHSRVEILQPAGSDPLVMGYAYIPESPFILMIVKNQAQLMDSWNQSRFKLIFFLTISVGAILLVVLSGNTFLVNQIYLADQRRLAALHNVEYANKMASLGRLSAGVAHEINNPLAIIGEKAGYIKDLFTIKGAYAEDPKLMALIDAIASSVERCAGITHRLLNFARRSPGELRPVNVAPVVDEVLGFMGKEAEYRSIEIVRDIPSDTPQLNSDPGRLQEIFLNLFTNALAAMEDGGRLTIAARATDERRVMIHVTDSGHGIAAKNLERIFEPFYSTKLGQGGTGLGLAITYGLVQELGGTIEVASEEGQGTTFTLQFPQYLAAADAGRADEASSGGTNENTAG